MTTLTINLDEQIKNNAQKRVKKEGLTLTAIISRFLKEYSMGEWGMKLSREGKEILQASRELDEEIANGTAKVYNDVDELMDDVLNEPDE